MQAEEILANYKIRKLEVDDSSKNSIVEMKI